MFPVVSPLLRLNHRLGCFYPFGILEAMLFEFYRNLLRRGVDDLQPLIREMLEQPAYTSRSVRPAIQSSKVATRLGNCRLRARNPVPYSGIRS